MDSVERQPGDYPLEVRDLVEARRRIEIGSRLLLGRGEKMIYYQEPSGREWLAHIKPQDESLRQDDVSSWAGLPYSIFVAGFFPSTSIQETEESFKINTDPTEPQDELRVRAVGPKGESLLDKERKVTTTALKVLKDGLPINWALLGDRCASFDKLGLKGIAIDPSDFKPDLDLALRSLETLRNKRPLLFDLFMPLMVNAASLSDVYSQFPLLDEIKSFYFSLLSKGLTPQEMGTYGKNLLPQLEDNALSDHYSFLEREVKRARREFKKKAVVFAALSSGVGFCGYFTAFSLARKVLPSGFYQSIAGLAAGSSVYFPFRIALLKRNMIEFQKKARVEEAFENVRKEQERRRLEAGFSAPDFCKSE